MRRLGLFLVAALSLAATDHPDLAGKWELNMQKSTFSQKNYNPGRHWAWRLRASVTVTMPR